MSFDHRYLWSTDFIRNQLRLRPFEEATTFRYFLAIMAFDWLQFSLIATTPSPSISPWSIASSWSTFAITVLGLCYLYRKNGGSDGRHFLHRYFPLSVTVGWKFVITTLAAVWLIPAMLQGQSDEAVGWCTSAVLAVINTLMFWRIGLHLGSLAKAEEHPPR